MGSRCGRQTRARRQNDGPVGRRRLTKGTSERVHIYVSGMIVLSFADGVRETRRTRRDESRRDALEMFARMEQFAVYSTSGDLNNNIPGPRGLRTQTSVPNGMPANGIHWQPISLSHKRPLFHSSMTRPVSMRLVSLVPKSEVHRIEWSDDKRRGRKRVRRSEWSLVGHDDNQKSVGDGK